ncbi:hypothetical protein OQI89_15645 [Lentilactobacillus diolivorans]|uniref:hypothetical protein n=1 Tax=Lentilactobacillus diolivorans TaxID=179838 RepID=UPI0024689AA6|nr:hypothetical protein [Lentilactobacillus diolivorans]MDH5107257.1 hypothetical protein [Lentilactobacillus diolivorans]
MTEKYVLEQPNGQFLKAQVVIDMVNDDWIETDPDPQNAVVFRGVEEATTFAERNLVGRWSIVKLSDARMADFWKQSKP